MEETITSVVLTLAFQDSTSRNYTFSGIEDSVQMQIKQKVKALNANMPASFKNTFVSNSGAPCVMIGAAKLIITTEEVIYNAG